MRKKVAIECFLVTKLNPKEWMYVTAFYLLNLLYYFQDIKQTSHTKN